MEQNRDEQIACADCGASFLFSAAEAAIFDQRGLSAPKRCKDCRRARKEQKQMGGNGPSRQGPRDGQRSFGGPPRRGPGFSNDANGYRPPAQDRGFDRPSGPQDRGYDRPMGVQQDRGYDRPAGMPQDRGYDRPMSPPQDHGYDRPMGMQDNAPRDSAPTWSADGRTVSRPPRRPAPPPQWGNDGSAPPMPERGRAGFFNAQGHAAQGPRNNGPRLKATSEMFPITCNGCGQQSSVPFKPAEGRHVFCQQCYRARKPS